MLGHEIARIADRIAVSLLGVRNRIPWVADVLIKKLATARWTFALSPAFKDKLAGSGQIQRRINRSCRGPIGNIAPLVRAGVENIDFLNLRDIAFVLQEIIEERQLEVRAVGDPSLRSEVRGAKPVAIRARPAAVTPGPDNQHVVDSRILFLNRLISSERPEQVFVVVPAADGHHRGVNVLEVWKNISLLPELIVVRVLHHLVPELNAHAKFLLVNIAGVLQPAHI